MKIWKWILAVIAAVGGAAALASTKDKKKYKQDVKENEEQVKAVQEKAAQAEAERIRFKKQNSQAKKKAAATKAQVKDTTSAKQTTKNFEKKYRRKPKAKS